MSTLANSASDIVFAAGSNVANWLQRNGLRRQPSLQNILTAHAQDTGQNGPADGVQSALDVLRARGQMWQGNLRAALEDADEGYQRFVKTRIDPLFEGKRHQMMRELVAEEEDMEITPYERKMNQGLAISGVITLAAVATAPVGGIIAFVASVPLAFYLIRDTYKWAYVTVKEERRLTIPFLFAFNQTLLWLGGFYVLGGVIFIMTRIGQKITFITEVRSQRQIANIFGTLPRSVWILKDGMEIEIPFDQLYEGDVLIIRAGQLIPIDGRIVVGNASIDQHRLTGESQPAEKAVGDEVLAGTVVLAGEIQVQVEKTGEETVAAQIGEMLNKTASYQMALTTKARQMADKSVAPTLAVAALAGVLIGSAGVIAVTSTMFGLNLMISGPLALRNYLLVATRRSILIKDGRSLDLLTEIDTIVFDKTGTLTLDQPHVKHIHLFAEVSSDDLLRYAAAIEQHQSHPIARAILAFAREREVEIPKIDDTRYELGYGLKASIEGRLIRVGSDRFIEMERIALAPQVQELQAICQAEGHSLVMIAMENRLVGAIELEPTIRPEAKAVIAELRQRDIDFYIISGDQEGPTRKLAQTLGIDNYFANTLPENKAKLVEQLQDEGRSVCFVGDGINDSIALKKANVSVSLRGSTTVAMDTAQIVLMDMTLEQLPLLFQLAEEMEENLNVAQVLAIVPVFGIWGGIFFLKLGILGATLIFEASLWVGIANALRPLMTYKEGEEVMSPAEEEKAIDPNNQPHN